MFLVWALTTLLFSIFVVGAKLFLIYLYGWSKVLNEHLYFLDMPKERPWPVSNGDLITEGFFIHYLFTAACWLVPFCITYLPLRLLLPKEGSPRIPYVAVGCLLVLGGVELILTGILRRIVFGLLLTGGGLLVSVGAACASVVALLDWLRNMK